MSSIKDLFLDNKIKNFQSSQTLESASVDVESIDMVKAKVYSIEELVPPVDYSTASNFAKFGSAELYYEYGFKRIYQEYPYDGTLHEKQEFENSSSYLDKYIFENLYPRTNGYIDFGTTGYSNFAPTSIGRFYKNNGSGTDEYIYIMGGPHTASGGMQGLAKSFAASTIYDPSKNRASNLQLVPDTGFTVEFWMKKSEYAAGDNTSKEIIFDLWNQDISASQLGRFTVIYNANSGTPQLITGIYSGSHAHGVALTSDSLIDGKWHHYAVSGKNTSNGINWNCYVDGKLEHQETDVGSVMGEISGLTGGMNAAIGSFVAGNHPAFGGPNSGLGIGKLTGSLDEFRFWKTERNAKQIGLNYFTHIGGGTDDHDSNTDLGVYFKFNEGITLTSSVDATVLDYSGRLSNGSWVGYPGSTARHTDSAMVLSGKATKEFKDPIIYSAHPDVAFSSSFWAKTGSIQDYENSSLFYNLLPDWLTEQDRENGQNVFYLCQIMSSYFDTLYGQISYLSKMKHKQYLSSSYKAIPFTRNVLRGAGFVIPDTFIEASIVEKILDQDDNEVYEKSISEVKNLIYQNIYNNLTYIYKSKGTEKSFRNFFRCFGVDSDLLKLNLYSDDSTYLFRDNYEFQSRDTNVVNFNHTNNYGANVIIDAGADGRNHLTGGFPAVNIEDMGSTLEVEVIFPNKLKPHQRGYFTCGFVTSSICGIHTVDNSDYYTYHSTQHKYLQLYAIRTGSNSSTIKDSPDGYFMLTGSGLKLTSSVIYNLYDTPSNKWNFAIRHKPTNYTRTHFTGAITSSNSPFIGYTVELYGISTSGNEVLQTVEMSTDQVEYLDGFWYHAYDKGIYIGADRQNFTGALQHQSDVKIGDVKYWNSIIDNETLKQHSFDVENFGTLNPNRSDNPLLFSNVHIPQIDTLALHWEFVTNTGSDSSGEFLVSDVSSGSTTTDGRYGVFDGFANQKHNGKGRNFLQSSEKPFEREYVYTAISRPPAVVFTSDMIKLYDLSGSYPGRHFFTDDDVTDNFYAFEKSMQSVISDEMIRSFASIKDFNNLVGNPVNRYRMNYKELDHLKMLFFEHVENEPDVEKFFEFYKWIDQSISVALSQLVPASNRFANGVANVIESHVLERNKYQNKFPLVMEEQSTEGTVKGVKELMYNWGIGHAPDYKSTATENTHCFWQKHRKQKPDAKAEVLRRVMNTENVSLPPVLSGSSGNYIGSTYVIRNAAKPYRFKVEIDHTIHGGINYNKNKNRDYVYYATRPHGPITPGPLSPEAFIAIGFGTGSGINTQITCLDDSDPSAKNYNDVIMKAGYASNLDEQLSPRSPAYDYENSVDGQYGLPFQIRRISRDSAEEITSLDSGFNSEVVNGFDSGSYITNVHSDTTYFNNDVPMQGPFTEQWVGGHTSRHIDLNQYDVTLTTQGGGATPNNLDDEYSRPEAWQLLFGDSTDGSAMGLVGPDYGSPYPDHTRQMAVWYRDGRTKRPVNVQNIQHRKVDTNNSGTPDKLSKAGNFNKNYEVVNAVGRSENNFYFRSEQGAVDFLSPVVKNSLPHTTNQASLFGKTTGSIGNVFSGESNLFPSDIHGLKVQFSPSHSVDGPTGPLDEQRGTKSIITQKFSAPGGPEVQSPAFLDAYANEKSPYNALSYRNLTVRGRSSGENGTIQVANHLFVQGDTPTTASRDGLQTLLRRHSGKFGLDSEYGVVNASNYVASASFQKQHRNYQYAKLTTGSYYVCTASVIGLAGSGSFVIAGAEVTGAFASGSFEVTGVAKPGTSANALFTVTSSFNTGSKATGFFWITGAYDNGEGVFSTGSFKYKAIQRGYPERNFISFIVTGSSYTIETGTPTVLNIGNVRWEIDSADDGIAAGNRKLNPVVNTGDAWYEHIKDQLTGGLESNGWYDWTVSYKTGSVGAPTSSPNENEAIFYIHSGSAGYDSVFATASVALTDIHSNIRNFTYYKITADPGTTFETDNTHLNPVSSSGDILNIDGEHFWQAVTSIGDRPTDIPVSGGYNPGSTTYYVQPMFDAFVNYDAGNHTKALRFPSGSAQWFETTDGASNEVFHTGSEPWEGMTISFWFKPDVNAFQDNIDSVPNINGISTSGHAHWNRRSTVRDYDSVHSTYSFIPQRPLFSFLRNDGEITMAMGWDAISNSSSYGDISFGMGKAVNRNTSITGSYNGTDLIHNFGRHWTRPVGISGTGTYASKKHHLDGKIRFGQYNHIIMTLPWFEERLVDHDPTSTAIYNWLYTNMKIWINGVEKTLIHAGASVQNNYGSNIQNIGGNTTVMPSLEHLQIGGSQNAPAGLNAGGNITQFSIWKGVFTEDAMKIIKNGGRWFNCNSHPSASYLHDWWQLGDESPNAAGSVTAAGATYADNNYDVSVISPHPTGGFNYLERDGGGVVSDYKVDWGLIKEYSAHDENGDTESVNIFTPATTLQGFTYPITNNAKFQNAVFNDQHNYDGVAWQTTQFSASAASTSSANNYVPELTSSPDWHYGHSIATAPAFVNGIAHAGPGGARNGDYIAIHPQDSGSAGGPWIFEIDHDGANDLPSYSGGWFTYTNYLVTSNGHGSRRVKANCEAFWNNLTHSINTNTPYTATYQVYNYSSDPTNFIARFALTASNTGSAYNAGFTVTSSDTFISWSPLGGGNDETSDTIDGATLTIGSSVFEFHTASLYGGSNIGVSASADVTNTEMWNFLTQSIIDNTDFDFITYRPEHYQLPEEDETKSVFYITSSTTGSALNSLTFATNKPSVITFPSGTIQGGTDISHNSDGDQITLDSKVFELDLDGSPSSTSVFSIMAGLSSSAFGSPQMWNLLSSSINNNTIFNATYTDLGNGKARFHLTAALTGTAFNSPAPTHTGISFSTSPIAGGTNQTGMREAHRIRIDDKWFEFDRDGTMTYGSYNPQSDFLIDASDGTHPTSTSFWDAFKTSIISNTKFDTVTYIDNGDETATFSITSSITGFFLDDEILEMGAHPKSITGIQWEAGRYFQPEVTCYQPPTFDNDPDNFYKVSLLPNSDFQYAWINNSISGTYSGERDEHQPLNGGFAPYDGFVSSSEGYVPAIAFPTASTERLCGCAPLSLISGNLYYEVQCGTDFFSVTTTTTNSIGTGYTLADYDARVTELGQLLAFRDKNDADVVSVTTSSYYDNHNSAYSYIDFTASYDDGSTLSERVWIKIVDNTPPTIVVGPVTQPANQVTVLTESFYDAIANGGIFDTCSPNVEVTMSIGYDLSNFVSDKYLYNSLGQHSGYIPDTYNVKFAATDSAGNASQAFTTITFEDQGFQWMLPQEFQNNCTVTNFDYNNFQLTLANGCLGLQQFSASIMDNNSGYVYTDVVPLPSTGSADSNSKARVNLNSGHFLTYEKAFNQGGKTGHVAGQGAGTTYSVQANQRLALTASANDQERPNTVYGWFVHIERDKYGTGPFYDQTDRNDGGSSWFISHGNAANAPEWQGNTTDLDNKGWGDYTLPNTYDVSWMFRVDRTTNWMEASHDRSSPTDKTKLYEMFPWLGATTGVSSSANSTQSAFDSCFPLNTPMTISYSLVYKKRSNAYTDGLGFTTVGDYQVYPNNPPSYVPSLYFPVFPTQAVGPKTVYRFTTNQTEIDELRYYLPGSSYYSGSAGENSGGTGSGDSTSPKPPQSHYDNYYTYVLLAKVEDPNGNSAVIEFNIGLVPDMSTLSTSIGNYNESIPTLQGGIPEEAVELIVTETPP